MTEKERRQGSSTPSQDPTPTSPATGVASGKWRRWTLGGFLFAVAGAGAFLLSARAKAPDNGPLAMTDSAQSVRSAYSRCASRKGQEKRDCYQKELTERLRTRGVGPAMATLEGLYEKDGDVERDAHVYAHHIGIQAYELTPDVIEVFSQCSDMYSSGCFHGVLQAYFEDRGAVDHDAVNELCEPYKGAGQSRWILFQCLHGMGHGLTMYFGHNLTQALDRCDLLEQGWDRESCYGGAFMENIMHATDPHHPANVLAEEKQARHEQAAAAPFKALDPADPLYPCSVLEGRYLPACYLMQTSAILYLNGNDIAGAAETCGRAPARLQPICFQSLGRDITSVVRQDPKRSERQCGHVPETYRPDCYQGVVKALVDWRSAAEPGLVFCHKVKAEAGKKRCYQALGEEIGTLVASEEERASLCRRAEGPYQSACRAGARLPASEG